MSIYARTLLRDWYLADVCNSWHFESSIERAAFIETFEECQRIVAIHTLNPEGAAVALFELKQKLKVGPKPSIFSRARWFYKPLDARLHAVQVAGELVEGISERYLP